MGLKQYASIPTHHETKHASNERGVSLLESLIVLLAIAILISIGVRTDIRSLQSPLITESSNLASFFKHARSKAVSTTSAVLVKPIGYSSVKAIKGMTCDSIDQNAKGDFKIVLAPEVAMTDTDWSTCFTSRGLATENVVITMTDNKKTKTIEVMLGGGSRIQ